MISNYLILLLLFTTSAHASAQVYYKNVCSEPKIASWNKINNQMKSIKGTDHPQIIKKIKYCGRFQAAINEGKCREAITTDKYKRSAEVQLKNGGPYNRCLQDVVKR